MLNFSQLRSAKVNSEPFPHLIECNSIAEDELPGLLADFPDVSVPGSIPVSELAGGPNFQRFITELEGPNFRELLEQKFSLDLNGRPVVTTARGKVPVLYTVSFGNRP